MNLPTVPLTPVAEYGVNSCSKNAFAAASSPAGTRAAAAHAARHCFALPLLPSTPTFAPSESAASFSHERRNAGIASAW